MTEYSGCKSLDAEITLNFVTGTINMNYSFNKLGNIFDSNTSIILNDTEWNKLSIIEKIKRISVTIILLCGIIPFNLFTLIFTLEERLGFVRYAETQYLYQRILKWYYSNISGIWEQSKSGELYDNLIIFTIPHNIWVEYLLDGDYQKNIKSISLVRNFMHHLKFGKFSRQRQQGWNVIFEFTTPPKNGSCIIKYV